VECISAVGPLHPDYGADAAMPASINHYPDDDSFASASLAGAAAAAAAADVEVSPRLRLGAIQVQSSSLPQLETASSGFFSHWNL
jgi:hypothetical protein